MRQMFMPGDQRQGQQQRQQDPRYQDPRQEQRQQGGLTARFDANPQQAQNQRARSEQERMLIQRALKKPRSMSYMNALRVLDAGDGLLDQNMANQLVHELQENLGTLDFDVFDELKGIVALCYLGDPYEVHTLDLAHRITHHFVSGEALPGKIESFRGMVMNGSFEFIEVYSTYACAVRPDGSVTLIES